MAEHGSSAARGDVVIAGGGVAALEALMALADLAGERVRVTLVSPEADFVHRPLAVAEPFALAEVRRSALREIADEFDARLVRAGLRAVDPAARRVELRSGDQLGYDTLILAPGARALPALDGALTFAGPAGAPAMRALVDDLAEGRVRSVAFVVPSLVGWSLPLYELALLTARAAASRGRPVELTLVSPELRPLAIFGPGPRAAVGELLEAARIRFVAGTYAESEPGGVRLSPGGTRLAAERVVALPLVRGPRLDGVPLDHELGFIPVDRHGRVEGLEDVYAAGDATTYPVKQGGLAAQQADAVAQHVAARHGAPVEPLPFRPVLRGMLFTGGPARFLRSDAADGAGETAARPLWWPPTKSAGRYLAPYLFARAGADPGPPPPGFADLELALQEDVPAPAGG